MRILSLIVAAILCISLVGAEPAGEFVDLFNGKDLTGWEGDPDLWSVKDGAIVGQTSAEKPLKKNSFLMWRGGKPGDFELHATWKIAGGNSGVQYRSKDEGDHVAAGYQADIVGADPDKYTGILYEERGRGILAQRGEKVVIDSTGKKSVVGTIATSDEILKNVKKGDWNEYVIIAQGNHIVQKLNGQITVDVTDEQTANAARDGIIALQLHVGAPMHVEFKEIKLKELKAQ
jgi:hypothetical protein